MLVSPLHGHRRAITQINKTVNLLRDTVTHAHQEMLSASMLMCHSSVIVTNVGRLSHEIINARYVQVKTQQQQVRAAALRI